MDKIGKAQDRNPIKEIAVVFNRRQRIKSVVINFYHTSQQHKDESLNHIQKQQSHEQKVIYYPENYQRSQQIPTQFVAPKQQISDKSTQQKSNNALFFQMEINDESEICIRMKKRDKSIQIKQKKTNPILKSNKMSKQQIQQENIKKMKKDADYLIKRKNYEKITSDYFQNYKLLMQIGEVWKKQLLGRQFLRQGEILKSLTFQRLLEVRTSLASSDIFQKYRRNKNPRNQMIQLMQENIDTVICVTRKAVWKKYQQLSQDLNFVQTSRYFQTQQTSKERFQRLKSEILTNLKQFQEIREQQKRNNEEEKRLIIENKKDVEAKRRQRMQSLRQQEKRNARSRVGFHHY